jgi:branched-subunit amino acid transport protein AzlD
MTSTAAMIPVVTFSPKLTPFWVLSIFQQPEIVSCVERRERWGLPEQRDRSHVQ